jgi:hypothetical protein
MNHDGSNGEPYVNTLPYLVIPIREWDEQRGPE